MAELNSEVERLIGKLKAKATQLVAPAKVVNRNALEVTVVIGPEVKVTLEVVMSALMTMVITPRRQLWSLQGVADRFSGEVKAKAPQFVAPAKVVDRDAQEVTVVIGPEVKVTPEVVMIDIGE